MKIVAIRLKNLASIEGMYEIDFEAEPLRSAGIFAISGPTGAGKSTLLDALCLALYDKTPRFAASGENLYLADVGENQVNQSDVKNILRRGTGEGFAEVDFLGATGHRYRSRWSVRRARSKATGSLQPQVIQVTDLNTNEELQGTKTELLSQLVALVGLTYEQFTRTVLLAQNDFATFLKSRESAKAELLEKLTGTDIYSRISKEVYTRYKTADEALNLLKSSVSLIELLPEEEWQTLQEEKATLTERREKDTKLLAGLNEQLNVIRSLNVHQEQWRKKQEQELAGQQKRKLLLEGLASQTENLALFREQCEALQPDLRKARELDVQLQSLSSVYKQAEQSSQFAGKQTAEQRKKLRSGQEALNVASLAVKRLLKEEADADEVLAQEGKRLLEEQKVNDERVVRLNAFDIRALGEEQSKLMHEQTRLQDARQRRMEWQKAEQEAVRLETLLAEEAEKQDQSTREQTTLGEQLTVKEGQLKTLQRLYENARLAMSKDVQALRQNLRVEEACPVCGSTEHPYRQEQRVADTLYLSIEQEYKVATEQYQQLNNRNIALKQELRHQAEQRESTMKQLAAIRQEAQQKCPPTEEEKQPEYFEQQLKGTQGQLTELASRLREYQQLYEEWQRQDATVKQLRSYCEALREAIGQCRLSGQQVTSATEQLTVFETAETVERERFATIYQEFSRLRAERGALLKGKTADEAEAAILKREKELNTALELVRKEVENSQTGLSGLQGEMKQLRATVEELTQQCGRIETPERLPETIAIQQAANQQTERLLSVAEARMLQQVQNKTRLEQIGKELTEKQEIANRWGKLNKLIGSADGTKFKIIAQSYTLNLLLMHANQHLAYLSKRYKLQQVPGTLALQVIDRDMCDEVRTVYSLSGGESFLISLALALGLSSLSSHNLKVESLFIDEGFGSLDADSLRTAMEALEQLQMQGRKIGVISHVQEMSERISVQIQIQKAVNGKSSIRCGE